jgi:hypothetical protein
VSLCPAGLYLCFSRRARSTLALSSALIWSEMTICSTTWWATPGRVCWSRSKSTAPEIKMAERAPHPRARNNSGGGQNGRLRQPGGCGPGVRAQVYKLGSRVESQLCPTSVCMPLSSPPHPLPGCCEADKRPTKFSHQTPLPGNI